jgi:excinuclease UvrABC ATPase subunit
VAAGTPEAIVGEPASYTGRFLAEVLGTLPIAAQAVSRR